MLYIACVLGFGLEFAFLMDLFLKIRVLKMVVLVLRCLAGWGGVTEVEPPLGSSS